jgi:photosystem II stability/assembly factor-like uncharacterized protein
MSDSVKTDKFKVNETAPFFPDGPMGPTGSYSSGSFKSEYVLKFKDRETKSVIKSSGIVDSNNEKISLPNSILISLTDFGATWNVSNNCPQKTWADVSSSETGQYQTAVARDDYIYLSSNFGATWDVSNNSPQKYWESVSMSASGEYRTAVSTTTPNGGNPPGPEYIYVSSNSGETWTQKQNDASNNSLEKRWYGVSMSASGQYQTAVANNGYIYVSSNYGVTWTPKESDTSNNSLQKYWYSVTMNASGKYQTAVPAGNQYIYASTDFGNTWTPSNSSPEKSWQGVSMSASGKYRTAVAYNDYIYVSIDYGNTWTQKQNDTSNNSLQKNWYSVAMTASGQYQSATLSSGNDYIYISTDFGNTWTQSNSPQKSWRSVSLSASGEYHTAVANDYIYTSISSTGP